MDQERLTLHKLRNGLQSLSLVGAMAGLCGYLAWLIGGAFGAWLALTFVVVAYALNPAASPRLVMGLFRAEPIHPRSAPRLYAVLEALACGTPVLTTPFGALREHMADTGAVRFFERASTFTQPILWANTAAYLG